MQYINDILPSFEHTNLVYPLLASIRDSDPYFVLMDFDDYCAKQNAIQNLYNDRLKWLAISLKSIARTGWFSADRLVNEYARDIWKVL